MSLILGYQLSDAGREVVINMKENMQITDTNFKTINIGKADNIMGEIDKIFLGGRGL